MVVLRWEIGWEQGYLVNTCCVSEGAGFEEPEPIGVRRGKKDGVAWKASSIDCGLSVRRGRLQRRRVKGLDDNECRVFEEL